MVIPPFRRGSGGHNTLLQILCRLERRGHACSVWLAGRARHIARVGLAGCCGDQEFFAPFEAPVYKGFEEWQGADVVIATGWQTVHPALALTDAGRGHIWSTTTSPSSSGRRSSG